MAALAYLLLPLSGLIAYLTGGDARVRFHGLQAIVFGTGFAVALYIASATSAMVTVIVTAIGALVWVLLLVGAGLGRDPRLPGLADALWRLAQQER